MHSICDNNCKYKQTRKEPNHDQDKHHPPRDRSQIECLLGRYGMHPSHHHYRRHHRRRHVPQNEQFSLARWPQMQRMYGPSRTHCSPQRRENGLNDEKEILFDGHISDGAEHGILAIPPCLVVNNVIVPWRRVRQGQCAQQPNFQTIEAAEQWTRQQEQDHRRRDGVIQMHFHIRKHFVEWIWNVDSHTHVN